VRADARRNREQIVEAARALFIRIGPDVPMEEIARAAGVGIGTLYRRFPDRDELIKAVNLDNFARLAELARRIERDEPDPAAALATLLHATLELRLGITMTAVSARAYRAIQDSPAIAELRDEAVAVATRLLHRAQELGTIRPDIEIGDVVLSLVLVSRMAPMTGNGLSDLVFRRQVALMIAALRATPAPPLPGRPVTYQDIEDLRRRGDFAGFAKSAPTP
jgi:AcrR family transcriptional regulator